jgi:hypothetical protein
MSSQGETKVKVGLDMGVLSQSIVLMETPYLIKNGRRAKGVWQAPSAPMPMEGHLISVLAGPQSSTGGQ